VRLTVDLPLELELASDRSKPPPDDLSRLLSPLDVVLPTLASLVDVGGWFEDSKALLEFPAEPAGLAEFERWLGSLRRQSRAPVLLPAEPGPSGSEGPWTADDLKLDAEFAFESGRHQHWMRGALTTAVLGQRRWRLATTTYFLARSFDLVLGGLSGREAVADPLALSIAGTLAAFAEAGGRWNLSYKGSSLHEMLRIIANAAMSQWESQGGLAGHPAAAQVVEHFEQHSAHRAYQQNLYQSQPPSKSYARDLPAFTLVEWAVLLYVTGPDPLTVLTARILGLPDRDLSGGATWLRS
jgi:hypothetical protein